MIRRFCVIDPVHSMLLLWNECGEDPFIFCYRIGVGACMLVLARATTFTKFPFLPLMLSARVGSPIGYWTVRTPGAPRYRREDSLFFRRIHLQRAHGFYEK